MNQQSHPSRLGVLLANSLQKVETYEQQVLQRREKSTIHVPTVGSTLSSAYEQLRNASEYAESDLLQQRAIRRYLKRVLSFHSKVSTKHMADELIVELTQAEYLANDQTTQADTTAITLNINKYYDAYWQYAERESNVAKRQAFQDWMLDVLSVRCEQILQSHIRQLMFAHFAYMYLQDKIEFKKLIKDNEKISRYNQAIVLYIAIHSSLLKSDTSTIRSALLDSYKKDIDDSTEFVRFNEKLDKLFSSKTTAFASRIIGKNGAALRFIYTGFFATDAPLSINSLRSQEALEQSLYRHIEAEYSELNKKLDRGIVRSIIFLLITKGLVGLGIEIPYDIAITGAIIWIPLIINFLFPAFFIIISRLTLSTPIPRNTTAVVRQISDMIFGDGGYSYQIRLKRESSSVGFNIVYAITFLLVFAGLTYLLYILDFNIVQGIIFFIFLSTASFLSFRLSRQINELEAVSTPQGTLALVRDIIYMPFIYVGQQISYRYSQVNVVAMTLDILIELPLKTILRLIRQWTQFLNAKKDELI